MQSRGARLRPRNLWRKLRFFTRTATGAHQLALVFAGFGDRDHTIERLQCLARAGPVRLGFTLNSPEFAFVRGDPRLKTLRKTVGLPE